jgi:hypothetical protein
MFTINIPTVTVHVHQDSDPTTRVKLDAVLSQLQALRTQGAQHMAVSEAIRTFASRVDIATNEIASDLKALRDKIAAGTPLTAEDQAELDRMASRLEDIGKDPENPVPGEPTEPIDGGSTTTEG